MEHVRPRTLVLCFDGTGDSYDDSNTNAVKLFSILQKDNKDQQLVYYQAGIGTYSTPGIMTGPYLWVAKILDKAFARYIDAHIMGGYEFLMQNYSAGDKICLFGFCRGAYTARALAGMLYKVGLLPRDNKEQIGFAYKMYKLTGKMNSKLAAGFKNTFCRSVQIEFLGCWDTVSIVGLCWGRQLPFTSGNPSVKFFRHALSLDERRAKFQPNLWNYELPEESGALPHSDPLHKDGDKQADTKSEKYHHNQPNTTDVLEVWFAGSHDDVGGGELSSEKQHSLSNISLRWMIRQIIDTQCGIHFDDVALEGNSILRMESITGNKDKDKDGASGSTSAVEESSAQAHVDALDAVQPLHDAVKRRPIWWVLEVVPLPVVRQDDRGVWKRAFRSNLGRGRTIDAKEPKVHATVQTRMADAGLKYAPRAKWPDDSTVTWVM